MNSRLVRKMEGNKKMATRQKQKLCQMIRYWASSINEINAFIEFVKYRFFLLLCVRCMEEIYSEKTYLREIISTV